MRLRLHIIIWMLLLSVTCAFAQRGPAIRLELTPRSSSEEIRTVNCNEQGLCILRTSLRGDTCLLAIQYYNTDLALTKEVNTTIAAHHKFVGATYNNGDLYLLYHHKLKKKADSFGMVYHYALGKNTIDTQRVSNLPTEGMYRFSFFRNTLYFIGDSKKNNSNLYFLSLNDPQALGILIKDMPEYAIEDYLIDTISQKVITCLQTYPGTDNSVILLCETSLEGSTLNVLDIPDTNAQLCLDAHLVQTDTDQYLIAGNYIQRNESVNSGASGIYSILYHNGQFGDFELYSYIPQTVHNNGERMMQRNMYYLPSRFYADSARFVFMTESFYPEYRYNNMPYGSEYASYHVPYYGSFYHSYFREFNDPSFIGYRFVNANAIVFDKNGKSLWEYTIPMDLSLTDSLSSHLKASPSADYLLFYYLNNNDLGTMLLDNQMNIIDPIRTYIFYANENKSTKKYFTTDLKHWYKDYYLLSGFRYKNTGTFSEKIPVYFFKKLRYQ